MMSEPVHMEVLAASRGRFLKTPEVSAEAHSRLRQAETAPFFKIVQKDLVPGVFLGLSLTVRFKVDRLEILTHLPRLLPGHLQGVTPDGQVTLSGPVLSLLAAWADITHLAFSPEWEALMPFANGFKKTIAKEFPEDSLLALQALIDRRKDATNEATAKHLEGVQ